MAVRFDQAAPGERDRQRQRYETYIKNRGSYGSTDREAAEALGGQHTTWGARRGELGPLVVQTTIRRETTPGYTASVWVWAAAADPATLRAVQESLL